jgi:hypothetical protein
MLHGATVVAIRQGKSARVIDLTLSEKYYWSGAAAFERWGGAMTTTMAPRGAYQPATRVRSQDPATTFLTRWLRVWVLLLTVVTMVVVVFLVVITGTLASINGNLRAADRSVTGVGQDVIPLPERVDQINGGLAAIDPALKPIPGQADEIIAALSSINSSLTATDASLKDTSSTLVQVLGSVGSITDLLINADDPPDRLGVQNIHRRVAAANGVGSPAIPGAAGGGGCDEFCTPSNLTTAESDAANILSQLREVNRHLRSACGSVGVSLLAGACR